MVVEEIVRAIAQSIQGLGFLSRVGGLAVAVPTGGGKLPAALLAPFADQKLRHLAPDDQETGVAWFEASTTRVLKNGETFMVCQNDVRLVLWLNWRRLLAENLIAAEVAAINAVKRTAVASDLIGACEIEYSGDDAQGPDALAKWAFDEEANGLALPPYRAVSHRFTITYTMAYGCGAGVATVVPTC